MNRGGWFDRHYDQSVEFRQLEAFVAVATELHFGRAAEKLHIGQPTLSDMVRRLEREMGTPLLTRTTRKVALTGAGSELLVRARLILDDVATAGAAVQRVARGHAGTVRVGITPPVAPVLGAHLVTAFGELMPDVELDVQRMWLFHVQKALAEGSVDILISCGLVPDPPYGVSEIICGEPLLVSVRRHHRLAGHSGIDLADLRDDTLGIASDALFPAWVLTQRQALSTVGVSPPTVELTDNHVSAGMWPSQAEVDWIMTTGSLADPDMDAVVLPVAPALDVPFVLQWLPDRVTNAAVGRFVEMCRSDEAVPPGWSAVRDIRRGQE